MRLRSAALAIASAFTLAGCSTYYDDWGYGGVSVGYGSGYHDPWCDPWYGCDDDWGYYSRRPYWGWFDGFYYPGTGIYIYDRWRRPFVWSDRHRRFWSDRHSFWRGRGDWREDRREFRDNWRDFRRDRRMDRRDFRTERQDDRAAFRRGDVTREQFRTDRRQDRREFRREFRRDARDLRRQNRRDRRD